MAAYAATVASKMVRPKKIGEDMYIYAGTVDITNYHQTLAAITGISGKFRSLITVLLGSVSTSGYLGYWVVASNAIKCYYPSIAIAAHTHDLFLKNAAQADAANNRVNTAASNKLGANTGADVTVVGVADATGNGGIVQAAAIGAGAGTQVASDVAVGLFSFVAFGVR